MYRKIYSHANSIRVMMMMMMMIPSDTRTNVTNAASDPTLMFVCPEGPGAF